ncbi:MAG: hypothetical protein NC921_03945 [Candidatus Omnitrophica bacterium]|nr:hypothetical protein [Candidatus Omnitrophota bacterium]
MRIYLDDVKKDILGYLKEYPSDVFKLKRFIEKLSQIYVEGLFKEKWLIQDKLIKENPEYGNYIAIILKEIFENDFEFYNPDILEKIRNAIKDYKKFKDDCLWFMKIKEIPEISEKAFDEAFEKILEFLKYEKLK